MSQRPYRSLVLPTASIAALLLTGAATSLAAESARPTPTPQPAATPVAPRQDAPPATTPDTPDRPAAAPAPAAQAEPQAQPATAPPAAPQANGGGTSPATTPPGQTRRVVDDNPVTLAFKEESVASIIPFIQEWTGKAVIVPLTKIQSTKITIVTDKKLPKGEALNLVFQALKVAGLGVVENDTVITIDTLTDISRISRPIVLDHTQDVMGLNEEGNFVIKTFRLKHAKAQDLADRIQEASWPSDGVSISVDTSSNQILLSSDVGLAKRVQLLIDNLDVPPHVELETRNYRVQYQDAGLIADNIRDLFEGSGTGGGVRAPRANAANARGRNQAQPGGQPGGIPQVGTSEQLVVTVVPALNTITVRAERPILAEIDRLMTSAWDLPPNKYGSPFRTYTLKYTDPLQVQATLQALLEGGSSGGASRTGGNRNNRAAFVPGGAGGGESGAQAAVANVFRIEAYPDSSQLVVISKTPENFPWLDEMVNALDQPLEVGLPVNVPLKYASAFKLAEIINVLLAEDGSGSGIEAPSEGLTGIDFNAAGGEGSTGGTERADAGAAGGAGGGAVQFPWQAGRGGQNGGELSPVSAAIGKARVVPNATQNSLLVLAPPQIQDSVLKIIEDLDRPGRQVMITAVLAEVSLGDGFSWGLRTGNNLTTLNGNDNAIGGSIDTAFSKGNGADTGGANFASPWFDVSTLDITSSVGFLLQALDTTNDVRILQEPRVFTSDNEEAKFFSGQDITFQTGQTTGGNTGGGTTSSFETRAVGIGLNVRPRITRELNVNMDIELLLSNLNLSVPQFNNNPVVDRRQTNTRITVKNGQTIVISGIRKEDETNIKRGLPLLGDIPFLGDAIFSSTEKKKNVSELVIFVTPLVVDNPDANDRNFNAGERSRLEELRKPLDKRTQPKGDRGFFENLRSVDPVEGTGSGDAARPEPAAPGAKPAEPPVDVPN
jgi:type II secretion system protein D